MNLRHLQLRIKLRKRNKIKFSKINSGMMSLIFVELTLFNKPFMLFSKCILIPYHTLSVTKPSRTDIVCVFMIVIANLSVTKPSRTEIDN